MTKLTTLAVTIFFGLCASSVNAKDSAKSNRVPANDGVGCGFELSMTKFVKSINSDNPEAQNVDQVSSALSQSKVCLARDSGTSSKKSLLEAKIAVIDAATKVLQELKRPE